MKDIFLKFLTNQLLTCSKPIHVRLDNSHKILPNVVVECGTLLPRIREIPGSSLGPETGYPD
jgi:hypothetical protein